MTVIDHMPADALATRIIDGPTGYTGVDGDEEWAADVRRLADLRARAPMSGADSRRAPTLVARRPPRIASTRARTETRS